MEKSILKRYINHALELNADVIEIEYKDGFEELIAIRNSFGVGIGKIKSSSSKAENLRKTLYDIHKKKTKSIVFENEYKLSVEIYDCFGENAFRLQIVKI